MIRVPLIWPVDAVIHRLDIPSTWAQDPPGPLTQGYDPVLKEPIISRDATGTRTSPRQELDAVRVPVQVEYKTMEQLRMEVGGNEPLSQIVFVAHREDLESLNLLDGTTRNCLLKPGDRVSSLERHGLGITVREFVKPLYIYRVDDGSQGFGPDGYDLEIIWTCHRDVTT